METELEKLKKERTGFALELTPYALKVAAALIVPLALVFLLQYFFHLEKRQVLLVLPFSFILSVFAIYRMYTHLARRAKENQKNIEVLQKEKERQDN